MHIPNMRNECIYGKDVHNMFGPRPDRPRTPPFGGLFNRRRTAPPAPSQVMQNNVSSMGRGPMQHSGQGNTTGGLLARLFQRSNPSHHNFPPSGNSPRSFGGNTPIPNPS